ncbi:hypothetical protein [Streptomyces parvulus]|uniref:hypothetical protein n=1 Tax=Streptomyces parvulus TaxID=146923 RepID=UPI001C68D178|nr:hypothetical protein [Streptomyces parvulus]
MLQFVDLALVEKTTLPSDSQRILAAVQQAAGPVMARDVGELLAFGSACGASWNRCGGRPVRLTVRGWLRKMPDGRFTARL